MSRLRLSGLALLVGSVVACADLPPIEGGTCGNGVVDPGEQCDTFATAGEGTVCGRPDEGDLACHYSCKDAASCPAGWGCGPDDRCRFASGAVTESTTIAAGFSELTIGDADGDGAADIVGRLSSGTAVQAWYGDGEGQFGSRFHINTGFGAAGASFGDLDDDGRTDVVVPLDEGLFVLLGKADRTLAPVAYSSFELPTALPGPTPVPLEDLHTFTIGFQPLYSAPGLLMEMGPPVNQLGLCFLNGCGDFSVGNFDLLGDKAIRNLAGRMPRANVDRLGNPEEEFAMGFVGESVVRIYSAQPFDLEGDGFFEARPWLRATILLPQPLLVPSELFGDPGNGRGHESTAMHFGDVDGDGNLDLIAAVEGSELGMQVAVARGNGDGSFQTAAIDARFRDLVEPDPANCELGIISVGSRYPWPLAVADFDPSLFDNRADYVTEAGIFMTRTASLQTKLCPTTIGYAGWTEAAVGDFNHDAHMDVAAIGADVFTGQRSRGVEFRIGDGGGHFNRVLLDTTHFATKLRAGDFDGDYVTDLAVVELDWVDDPTIEAESLSVLFGSAFGVPSPPVSMGRLSYIDILEPGYNPINILTFDVTTDLMAQSNSKPDGSGVNSIAVMVGTPERRMLSPFALQGSDGPDDNYTITDLEVGDLAGGASGEPFDDLLAVTNKTRNDTTADNGPTLWLIPGKARAEYAVSDAKILTADCPGPAQFAYGCAVFTSGDVDGDGEAELIAMDSADCRGGGASKLLVGNVQGQNVTCTTQNLPDGVGQPMSVRVVDIDMDGFGEVIVSFFSNAAEPVGGIDPGTAPLAVFWNDAGTIAAANPAIVQTSSMLIYGGTAANLDADPERELILLLDTGIQVAQIDVAGRSVAAPTPLFDLPFPVGRVAAGDVTGDGLEDLVFSDASQTHVFVSVPGGEEEVRSEAP